MNDHHLIPSTDASGKAVETIIPGPRPVEEKKADVKKPAAKGE